MNHSDVTVPSIIEPMTCARTRNKNEGNILVIVLINPLHVLSTELDSDNSDIVIPPVVDVVTHPKSRTTNKGNIIPLALTISKLQFLLLLKQ